MDREPMELSNYFKLNIRDRWLALRHMDDAQRQVVLKNVVLFGVMFVALYLFASLIPLGFWGFDWYHFFGKGIAPGFFLPWTLDIVTRLSFPAIFALSILALVCRAWRYKASPATLAMVIASLPTIWVVLFLGNIDALTIWGLLLLPIGVPLVLLKPQVASFALLAKRKWIIAGIIWGIISLLIWGFWPQRFTLITSDPNWKADWPQEISLFPWGALLALPLMWFSRGDEDMMMAAGSLMSPHLFPYHFIVLMPALARMNRGWRILTWVISWLPLTATWLGPIGWHFGNLLSLLSLCFWFGIYLNKKAAQPAILSQSLEPVPNQ
jgi:hypothetical protein